VSGDGAGHLLVNLAPTGMVPTRAMSPHVPLTVEEIVADVCRCIRLGVNVVHLHARDQDGRPTWRKEVYARIIAGIRSEHPQVVLGVSLSGRDVSDVDLRADPLDLSGDLRPDLASLTMSSLNFGSGASINAPDTVVALADRMAERGIRPELEIFDLGMLNVVEYLAARGRLTSPFYVNLILGNVAGAQPTPAHLAALQTALPPGAIWTAGGIGRAQRAATTLGTMFGHGVRIGLEDNIWADDARSRHATNESLVRDVLGMAERFERQVATPAEARRMLGLAPR
jgi:3-keto-5-aminohexanoate cleavage enzyme